MPAVNPVEENWRRNRNSLPSAIMRGEFWFAQRENLMIFVRITMNVLPEKQLEVTQTLFSMIEPTSKESGCLSYAVSCDIGNKNVFNLLEEWQSREDLDNHIRSERFRALLGTRSLLGQPLDFQVHTVSHSEGMEAIHAARGKNREGL
jgi:quinol monooxygenase YgiN